jgi:hypothetical protein
MKKNTQLPKEAREAAIAILRGARIVDVAIALGIGYQTCRSHLHRFCREANPEFYSELEIEAVHQGGTAPLTSSLQLHRYEFMSKPPLRDIEQVRRELEESEAEVRRLRIECYKAELELKTLEYQLERRQRVGGVPASG